MILLISSVYICGAKTVTVKNESKNRVYALTTKYAKLTVEKAIEPGASETVNLVPAEDDLANVESFVLSGKNLKERYDHIKAAKANSASFMAPEEISDDLLRSAKGQKLLSQWFKFDKIPNNSTFVVKDTGVTVPAGLTGTGHTMFDN